MRDVVHKLLESGDDFFAPQLEAAMQRVATAWNEQDYDGAAPVPKPQDYWQAVIADMDHDVLSTGWTLERIAKLLTNPHFNLDDLIDNKETPAHCLLWLEQQTGEPVSLDLDGYDMVKRAKVYADVGSTNTTSRAGNKAEWNQALDWLRFNGFNWTLNDIAQVQTKMPDHLEGIEGLYALTRNEALYPLTDFELSTDPTDMYVSSFLYAGGWRAEAYKKLCKVKPDAKMLAAQLASFADKMGEYAELDELTIHQSGDVITIKDGAVKNGRKFVKELQDKLGWLATFTAYSVGDDLDVKITRI